MFEILEHYRTVGHFTATKINLTENDYPDKQTDQDRNNPWFCP